MIDLGESFEGVWNLSVKCDFKKEPRMWKFHHDENDKDDWLANQVELKGPHDVKTALERKLTDRAEQLNGAFTYLRQQLGVTDNNGIQKWLTKGATYDLGFIDKDSAILFNHIVASQRTSPLKTIVSVVGNQRMTEIQGLLDGQPCWFYTQNVGQASRIGLALKSDMPAWIATYEHYALGFPTMFFVSTPDNKIVCREHIRTYVGQYLDSSRQYTEITILKYHVEEHTCTLQLRFKYALCHYHRGRLCRTIPIPGKSNTGKAGESGKPQLVDSPEVVISGFLVRKALSSLTDIWQDKADAVLVVGPPGSGKENYALSIPYGSGRKLDVSKGVPTISLASGTTEEQERKLFGYQQADGSIVDGLLAKSKGTAVFIDEAHYPEDRPGIRASLLRALEAKEYYPVGSMTLLRVEDVQWIFASSRTFNGSEKSLSKVPPPDFWTRMTHVIQIDHPLDSRAYLESGIRGYECISNEQEKVIKDLFKCFWWDRVKAHFGINPTVVLSGDNEPDDLREKDASEQIKRGYAEAMLKEKPFNDIAHIFSDSLMNTVGSQSLSDVSIRGLRSMVSRIFSRCVADVTGGMWQKEYGVLFLRPEGEFTEEGRNQMVSEQLPIVRQHIYGVIREIQQIARLKS